MDSAAARRRTEAEKGQTVCNGPYCEYFRSFLPLLVKSRLVVGVVMTVFRVARDEPKWLETALYIDHTVIKFHGNDTVQPYILTLINIGRPPRKFNLKCN